MDIYFNEKSVPTAIDSTDMSRLIEVYAQTVSEACNQGFSKVRYEKGLGSVMLSPNYSMAQYLNANSRLQSVKTLLATQARPYIPDGDVAEDDYITNDYKLVYKGTPLFAYGFIVAAIKGSMAIGFENADWNEQSYTIVLNNGSDGQREINVFYVYEKCQFYAEPLVSWSNSIFPIEISSSGLLPMQKSIHLSQHHGSDELLRFAKKIRKEAYVIEIVNSIDINPNTKVFARGSSQSCDLVEITLVKKGGFGLIIRTTARNIKEQSEIVKRINNQYS